jgi:phospho-2-dehydro-3-deoxyheptonate aldolase
MSAFQICDAFVEQRPVRNVAEVPVYGQSITDACIYWPETLILLRELAAAVKRRRKGKF